ncbi:hypothetical protein [Bacillus siamensis]|uniref:hypothetical protein n=1 Tax=Bacillus siamensis TaxID=659243 RepID=UPI003F6646DB
MNTKCIKDNKKLAADIPSASFFSFHHGEPSAGQQFFTDILRTQEDFFGMQKRDRIIPGLFTVCLSSA